MRASQRPVLLVSLVGVLASLALPAGARVLSYAPVTGRTAWPAVQDRTNRHYLLVETTAAYAQRLMLYDSKAIEEPRDVSPLGAESGVAAAACWEDPGVPSRILAASDASLGAGDNPQRLQRLLFSADAGATWKVVPVASTYGVYATFIADTGGRVVGSRGSQLRLGPAQFPFVFLLHGGTQLSDRLYALGLDGAPRLLAVLSAGTSALVGSDGAGFRFLVRSDSIQPRDGGTSTGNVSTPGVSMVDLSGNVTKLFDFAAGNSTFEGWITPFGDAYFDGLWYDQSGGTGAYGLRLFKGGTLTEIASGSASGIYSPQTLDFLSVPTNDFDGAWIVQREPGMTRLSSHTRQAGLVESWRDVAAPEIEAIHTSGFSPRLLIQVHRPRPQADQRIFKDPALALWKVGDPAPKDYDELFLDEQYTKGFVHLDVETVGTGEPFVFNSGATYFSPGGGGPSGGGGGGGDVIQEWGVVRGSLRQRLVIPVAARTGGYFGSQWRTDVLVRNGDVDPLYVAVRYVPNPGTAPAGWRDATVTVAGGAILTLTDILGNLFGLERGSGAVIFTPEMGRSLSATSRTYTSSARGSYGMGVGAVDLHTAIGANFDITFAAGLLGTGFRTNLVATDVSGGGALAKLRLASAAGWSDDVPFAVPPGGAQAQFDGLAGWLGAPDSASGSLLFSPRAGQTIAGLVAIDNLTNDPTYFPPDLSAQSVRTIPAIVHADGAFGAKFRTDLFLFNPSAYPVSATLAVKPWDTRQNESIVILTLAAHESRVLRDVLFTLFGLEGVGRLRYTSNDFGASVRMTSRTYTADGSGGTYGLLIPPLNEFQSAGPGESLEILGPTGGAAFRTNLALVELSAPFAGAPDPTVRIETLDDKGVLVDSFDTKVPLAGGVQLNDLFQGRGLGTGPAAVLIRVTPFGGLVAAYATTTDNGTNDPVYFGASLVAK